MELFTQATDIFGLLYEPANLEDVQAALAPMGMVAVSKSDLMTWYDVMTESIEKTKQYDHEQRTRSAIRAMLRTIQAAP